MDMFSLFCLVSALGAINELFELFMNVVFNTDIQVNDTSWDIVANTLGALFFYIAFKLLESTSGNKKA